MEFASLYLMFMHQGWFAFIIFFSALVKENKNTRGLKSRPFPQLGWSEWKLLELFKKTKRPKPSFASFWDSVGTSSLFCMRTLKSIFFPSSCPPSILFLVGVSFSKAPRP